MNCKLIQFSLFCAVFGSCLSIIMMFVLIRNDISVMILLLISTARAALAAVAFGQQFAEHRLATLQAASADAEHGGASWEANGDGVDGGAVGEEKQLKSNIVGYPESDDEDNSKVREVDSLPTELLELRRQLSYLRNEFSQV